MTVHALHTSSTQDAVQQVKVHLAAALRMAVLDGFDEGIDNHFTACVPGRPDQYFVLPFGLHWSEARASDMMIFNEAGQTLEGRGMVELSAQSIHAPLHRLTGAKVVLHTSALGNSTQHAARQSPASCHPNCGIFSWAHCV
jgi:ribulose-5-phosphate 4-epimerase/fuculose-1-phosphate aldolase